MGELMSKLCHWIYPIRPVQKPQLTQIRLAVCYQVIEQVWSRISLSIHPFSTDLSQFHQTITSLSQVMSLPNPWIELTRSPITKMSIREEQSECKKNGRRHLHTWKCGVGREGKGSGGQRGRWKGEGRRENGGRWNWIIMAIGHRVMLMRESRRVGEGRSEERGRQKAEKRGGEDS